MNGKPCPQCHGTGWAKGRRNLEVKIPAGVDTGSRVRMAGEGARGAGGSGDLYLRVTVRPDSAVRAEGRRPLRGPPVPVADAALGTEISVPTLKGQVSMKIPPETSSGRVFRLPAYGMPHLKGGGRRRSVRARAALAAEAAERAGERAIRGTETTGGGDEPMRLDKLTVKAQEAVQAAQSLPTRATIRPSSPSTCCSPCSSSRRDRGARMLAKLGARPDAIAASSRATGKLPKAQRRQPRSTASPRLRGIWDKRREGKPSDEGRVRLDRAFPDRHRLGQVRRRGDGVLGARRHSRGHLQGAGGRARQPARHRSESRGEVQALERYRKRPHRARAEGQARSGDRARRGDPPRQSRCCRGAPRTTPC